MKRFSIFLLLISFLLFTEAFAEEQDNHNSLAQKIKRGAESSKEFALSKDTGNFLLFALSAGFLIYLPKHLSNVLSSRNKLDGIIRWPYEGILNKAMSSNVYYELLTLIAGYTCLKTGKPVWEKFEKN